MGDAPPKSRPEQQMIKEVIFLCKKHSQIIIDEVAIHLAKQTTNNLKRWEYFTVTVCLISTCS